ncbi:MAG TPA: TM1802 family CRISPR-associated protein, partial [Candidatus Brocadiaceae bacterium]
MLSAIREIGKWQKEKLGKDELDVLIKKPNFKIGGKIVFIKVNIDEKRFEGVELEDFDSIKINRYLFKEGSSKGNKPSPIAQVTEPEKTFKKKIKAWLKKCSKEKLDSEDKRLLEIINNVIVQNEKEIILKIKEKTEDLKNTPKDKQGPIFLAVKLDAKYIGDFDLFPRLCNGFIEKRNLEVSSTNKICSICSEAKSVIFGDNADILKFSTIDKPGFIAGGLDNSIAWKNFSLCQDCRSEIKTGKSFVESKLSQ